MSLSAKDLFSFLKLGPQIGVYQVAKAAQALQKGQKKSMPVKKPSVRPRPAVMPRPKPQGKPKYSIRPVVPKRPTAMKK